MHYSFKLCLLLIGMVLFLTGHADVTCWVEDKDIRGTYQGGCNNGKAHGYGLSTGRDTYKGNFKNGFLHGQGTHSWPDGNKYEGMWKDEKNTAKERTLSQMASGTQGRGRMIIE